MSTPQISFDLDDIYNEKFSYSLPRNILEKYGQGLGFAENTVPYTPEEFKGLQKDIEGIWERMMNSNPSREGKVIVSAGAPGAGKTMLIHSLLKERPLAYICPDDVCLKNMTLYEGMIESDSSPEGLKKAYEKCRGGSLYALHLVTAHLIQNRFDFYFGTTASSDKTWMFFEFLKSKGYSIEILHVSASRKVCLGSIEERDKTIVQTTPKDIDDKWIMVCQRIQDTFLKYAVRIFFYFRPEVHKDAILTAVWTRESHALNSTGEVKIINPKYYLQVKGLHNNVCKETNNPQLRWEATVEGVNYNEAGIPLTYQ